jgi:hypothetical protein
MNALQWSGSMRVVVDGTELSMPIQSVCRTH